MELVDLYCLTVSVLRVLKYCNVKYMLMILSITLHWANLSRQWEMKFRCSFLLSMT